MTGIVIWQAFKQIFSIAHCGYQPVCEPCPRNRSYRHWMELQPGYRQPGYGEIALSGPIASPRGMRGMASGAVHSPEKSRCIARSTMNGRPLSTVGRHSVWSSWTDPYGITHTYIYRRRPKPAQPGVLECVPRCRAVADRFGGLQCRRLASSSAPGWPGTLGTPRTRSWVQICLLGPMAMDAPFAVTPLRLGSVSSVSRTGPVALAACRARCMRASAEGIFPTVGPVSWRSNCADRAVPPGFGVRPGHTFPLINRTREYVQVGVSVPGGNRW